MWGAVMPIPGRAHCIGEIAGKPARVFVKDRYGLGEGAQAKVGEISRSAVSSPSRSAFGNHEGQAVNLISTLTDWRGLRNCGQARHGERSASTPEGPSAASASLVRRPKQNYQYYLCIAHSVLCSLRRLKENKKNVRRRPSAMRPKRVVLARAAPDLRRQNVMTTMISSFAVPRSGRHCAERASGEPPRRNGSLKLGMTTWVGYGPMFLARDKGFFKENGLDVDLADHRGRRRSIWQRSPRASSTATPRRIDEIMKYRSRGFLLQGGGGARRQPWRRWRAGAERR